MYDLVLLLVGLKSFMISWTTGIIWSQVRKFDRSSDCFCTCALIIWTVLWHPSSSPLASCWLLEGGGSVLVPLCILDFPCLSLSLVFLDECSSLLFLCHDGYCTSSLPWAMHRLPWILREHIPNKGDVSFLPFLYSPRSEVATSCQP
jgi:hypothetical protein